MAGDTLHRKLIRDTTRDLLLNKTDVGANVFTGRINSYYEGELPAIGIYTPTETPMPESSHPKSYPRKIVLVVEIVVQKNDKPEDVADAIAGQIEDRLLPNIYLQNPPPKSIQETNEGEPGTEIIDNIIAGEINEAKEDEGLKDVYGLIMEFEVTFTYVVKVGIVTPFETGRAEIDVDGEKSNIEMKPAQV